MDKTVSIKNKQLACTIEGDPQNPPIIMIHSLGSHRGIWQQTIGILQEKYYCIAVDLIGFGASDKPDDADYSILSQGQRILLLADRLGLQRFSLIGHSMGGQIAFHIASVIDPQRIENLVGVNSIITGRLSNQIENKIGPFVKIARKWRNIYRFGASLTNIELFSRNIFKEWFNNFNACSFESWKVDRLAAFSPTSAISVYESFLAIRRSDLTQHLNKIKAHTLIIASRQDKIVPFDQALLAQTLIKNCDLAIIEKCGHFPMYEKEISYQKALKVIF